MKRQVSKQLEEKGIAVFGSSDNFHLWLNAPCKALGSITPMSLLATKEGQQSVMNELGRIEHGVFA
jgi:putative toxin-antitoxin system antitoxin component (TIGR02293 family)